MKRDAHAKQLLGSLLTAVAIVAVAIAIVTAKFGPTSEAERESLEERTEQRLEAEEERREQLLEAEEERRKDAGR